MMNEPLMQELNAITAYLDSIDPEWRTKAMPATGTSGTMTMEPVRHIGLIRSTGDYANIRITPTAERIQDIHSTLLAGKERLVIAKGIPDAGGMTDETGRVYTWFQLDPESFVRDDVATFLTFEEAKAKPVPTKFPPPFVGYIVTNRHGVNGHSGVDLATFDRTPPIVSAAMNGYVVKTALCGGCGATPGVRVKSNNFGFGNFVIVAYPLPDGKWLHALYGHLSLIHAIPGATLSDTSVIGNVGNSGDSSGNHLHIQTRLAATRDARWSQIESREVDPVHYFDI